VIRSSIKGHTSVVLKDYGRPKSICLIVLALLLFISIGCQDSNSSPKKSPEDSIVGVGIPTEVMVVHSTEQHGQNWCWAASAQMALSTQRVNFSQEAIVSKLFGDLVDRPGGVPHFLGLCGKYPAANGVMHVTCEFGDGPPPLNFLIDSLDENRPVILGCTNPGSNIGHAVVATAVIYRQTPKGPQLIRVLVRDPWPGQGKRILEAEEYANAMFHAVFKATPIGG
tara:strand:+ start:21706 stop:22380 length:675 start_codon:yes stop_codon:yes gene_type:complete